MKFKITFGIGKTKDLEIVKEYISYDGALKKAQEIAKERANLTSSLPATLDHGFTIEKIEEDK